MTETIIQLTGVFVIINFDIKLGSMRFADGLNLIYLLNANEAMQIVGVMICTNYYLRYE